MSHGLTSVLVTVGGYETDEKVVRFALEMLRDEKDSNLHLLYVIEVDPVLPVDAAIPASAAKGDAILRRMEELATSMRVESQAELLQARRVGYAIVQEAVEKRVEAVVMAAQYSRQFGRFTMGRTVPYVMENAPCKVILLRDAVESLASNGANSWGSVPGRRN